MSCAKHKAQGCSSTGAVCDVLGTVECRSGSVTEEEDLSLSVPAYASRSLKDIQGPSITM